MRTVLPCGRGAGLATVAHDEAGDPRAGSPAAQVKRAVLDAVVVDPALLDHITAAAVLRGPQMNAVMIRPMSADDHEDVADDVDVQAGDVEVDGESQDRADGDQEDADPDAHGEPPVG